MRTNDLTQTIMYEVVVNHEKQYSIWPEYKEVPNGWEKVGKHGTKSECLAHIKEVWTDMRPLSLQKKMSEASNAANTLSGRPLRKVNGNAGTESLVNRLSVGKHDVEPGLKPEKTAATLKACIDRGFVFIRFTNTKGGTELGFQLDEKESDFSQADFRHSTGSVRLVGKLTLDYVPVRCSAEIDLSTLSGKGYLEVIAA